MQQISRQQIWLIGGTQESAILARLLVQESLPTIATVITESARSLYPSSPLLQIRVGKLTKSEFVVFLPQHQISCILDASHPFAVEISQMAIEIAQQMHIPYLRYERPLEVAGNERRVPSVSELLATDVLVERRVLLTLGYRSLPLFQSWQSQSVLFARILPSAIALETALAAGFTGDRLIALRPPISPELERALWQQWQIEVVVTKASGSPGGETVKQQIANELGVQIVIIDRPPVAYPQQTSQLEQAIEFCRRYTIPDVTPQT